MMLMVRRVHRRAPWALLVGGLTLAALLLSGGLPARARAPLSLRFNGPHALPGSAGSSEPRVAVAPDGTEYVVSGPSTDSSAPSVPVTVYGSMDRGLTWRPTRSNPVQVQPSPDVDIVVTRTGRLVVVELDSAGLNLVVSYSDDQGRTWSASTGTNRIADQDRPWLAVGPDDPTTHQPRVYLLFHNAGSGNATENMYVETSTDGGATFGVPVPLTSPGSPAFLDLQCGDTTGPSSLAVNQITGRLYAFWSTRHGSAGGCGAGSPQPVTFVAATRVWVATSPDSSLGSWTTSLAVDDSAKGNIVGMQFTPGALDKAGNVYLTYTESLAPFPDFSGAAVRVRWAPPGLAHWSDPITVAPAREPGNVLPHIVAGDPGQLDVAYFAGVSGESGKPPKWYMTVARVAGANGSHATVSGQRLQSIPAYSGTASDLMGWCNASNPANQSVPACLMSRSTDVWGIALDAGCGLIVTWPTISSRTEPTIGASVDATWVATQSGGSSLCTHVSKPAVACARSRAHITDRSLGPVALGIKRARVRKLFHSFSTRGRRYMDFFCPQHRGIRVGYASSRLLGHLPPGARARVRGRAILILTADARYSLQGVYPGSTLKAAARTRRLSPPYRVGGNTWYLAPNGFSHEVLKVHHGVVQEIGIAYASLTRTPRAARLFLTSFSNPGP
jgi:hypothetical protein